MLPKISYPTISITVPSTKNTYAFRPMLVKEEKLLLMAKTSENDGDILAAIRQVVNNCATDPTFNIDKIPLFALEYLFLKLRGFSIGDEIKVSYRDFEDNEVYSFVVNLKQVEVRDAGSADGKIAITDKSGLVMSYPSASLYADDKFLSNLDEDAFYKLVVKCIDKIYDGDAVYESKDFSEADLLEFLELMDIKSFEKIRDFMAKIPTLYYKIEYTNKMDNKRTIELTSLSDFFTLR